MTSSPTITEKPKRHWLSFRLRMLFVLIFVVSLPLAWHVREAARVRRAAEREAKAMLTIEKYGGTFNGGVHSGPWPSGRWVEFWHRRRPTATEFDDIFEALKAMPQHVGLMLGFTIDDDQFERITQLQHLQAIELYDNSITDTGLLNILRLKRLQIFQMWPSSSLSIRAIERMKELSSLRLIGLYHRTFTAADLDHLYQTFPAGPQPRIALQIVDPK